MPLGGILSRAAPLPLQRLQARQARSLQDLLGSRRGRRTTERLAVWHAAKSIVHTRGLRPPLLLLLLLLLRLSTHPAG